MTSSDYYAFRYEIITLHAGVDVRAVVEVRKPGCRLPFTDVITNYHTRGLKPVFTDLFISADWGTCLADYKFLRQLWDDLEMDGTFDVDMLLSDATRRCLPQTEALIPDAEPRVYRRSLEEVRDRIMALVPVTLTE
ncbi:uncharacterized protein SPPG_00931 [Spizellomyces punctatus DAOM BR117]|uniref:Uncharacterized protein n=1 Tax=Spizellomyces punctatus (strain DAOM BR117) TaxID=645134 RepID=A0A0L0HQU8_SPIPD|nr:uncharacterized protein SPPG_00931 [Spizellomyces punctatus DAOM BR117]KND03448.1 hypothetical protein SPPG_00931 [Spizellomyces punctatus DAOM BR117]|eukprot:XP_016611487.1 hypothetical protein SPPG_00931 [Spizellomyces punctatus DAOM BR117]